MFCHLCAEQSEDERKGLENLQISVQGDEEAVLKIAEKRQKVKLQKTFKLQRLAKNKSLLDNLGGWNTSLVEYSCSVFQFESLTS